MIAALEQRTIHFREYMRKLFILTVLSALISAGCGRSPNSSLSNHDALHIAINDDPITLDPRLSRDLLGCTVIRMLFEGLTRVDKDGKVLPATAYNIDVSEDGKTYTFHLRETKWCDGTPLTAEDFAETWKSVLNPSFPSPNAYQLFVIQGARAAKEGKLPLGEVGIAATDPHTLVVKLEEPTPYFLELTSCPFYFPVCHALRSGKIVSDNACNGNGPFCFKNWERRSEFNVVKNPLYWDAANVTLPGVSLYTLDEHTAYVLYQGRGIDWVGSPLTTLPQDSIAMLNAQGQLEVAQGAGTHWIRLNTEKPPFTSKTMRRAFAFAIDRGAIVDHVTQGNQQAALAIVPPSLGWHSQSDLEDDQIAKAQGLFNTALSTASSTKSSIPKITLSYAAGDRNHKVAQALQQQWNKAFGIEVVLESSEGQVLKDKMSTGNYQAALGSWYADYLDPINFLEVFKYKTNATNQTFWENKAYIELLDRSSNEQDPNERLRILTAAEAILIDEMPVIPIFYSAYNYLKVPGIDGVYFSPLGYLDFKNAYFTDSGDGVK